jgi:hypothetical protein
MSSACCEKQILLHMRVGSPVAAPPTLIIGDYDWDFIHSCPNLSLQPSVRSQVQMWMFAALAPESRLLMPSLLQRFRLRFELQLCLRHPWLVFRISWASRYSLSSAAGVMG